MRYVAWALDAIQVLAGCFVLPFYFRYRDCRKILRIVAAQRDEAVEIAEAALSMDYPRLARLLKRSIHGHKSPRGDA